MMKRFSLAISLLLVAGLAHANCTSVTQIKASVNCGGGVSTCAITVTSTTGGTSHPIALWVHVLNSASTTISSVSGAGSNWVHCSNCHATDSNNNQVDGYYNLNPSASATTITPTISSTTGSIFIATMAEFGCTGTAALDTSASTTHTTCTSCAAPALPSFAGPSDGVSVSIMPNGAATAIGSPYSSNDTFPAGGDAGAAAAAGVTSYTAPNWTTTSGTDAVGAMAFNDTAAALTGGMGGTAGIGGKAGISW